MGDDSINGEKEYNFFGFWVSTKHGTFSQKLKLIQYLKYFFSFIRSFIQQILIEHIQNSMPFSRFQEFISEQNRQMSLPL